MAEDPKPKSSELVLRALVRLPDDLSARPHKDDDDFVRRWEYRKTGLPENGLSLLRKDKFPTAQSVWDRLRMSNPVGLAQCTFGKVESKGLKYKVTGEKLDHISVRCPDCDMADLPTICKPLNASDHSHCPFFDVDTFDLEPDFEEIEMPAKRTVTAKQSKEK